MGATFYLAMLLLHVAQHGTIRGRLGCVIGPEQHALNAPAAWLEAVAPNPWVGPQRFGEAAPIGVVVEDRSRWSALGWLAIGLLGYGLMGVIAGVVVGTVRARWPRRSR